LIKKTIFVIIKWVKKVLIIKILIISLVLSICTCCFVACNKHEHTFSAWKFSNTHHWKEYLCDCGEVENCGEHILDSSGCCSVCGVPLVETDGVIYDVDTDLDCARVLGYVGNQDNIKIAETFENLPVSIIAENAFKNSNIKTILLPSSIKEIHLNAFANCDYLQYNENGGLKYLGNIENPYLAVMGVEDSGKPTYQIDRNAKVIYQGVFAGQSNLQNIEIPNSVEYIGDSAFQDCLSLESIILSESIKKINPYTFSGCGSLNNAKIPYSVVEIAKYAFLGCAFTSLNIGGQVKVIEAHAFKNCDFLERLIIGDSVEYIGDSAFRGCDKLLSVTLGIGVKKIGNYAFAYAWLIDEFIFTDNVGWYITDSVLAFNNSSGGIAIDLEKNNQSATLIKQTYMEYYWYKR